MSQRDVLDVVFRVGDAGGRPGAPTVVPGPLITIGSMPQPGLVVAAPGIAPTHAVVEARGPLAVCISPVDGAEVRVSPHAFLDWRTVGPVRRRSVVLSGFAVHLGPPLSGRTVFFDGVRLRDGAEADLPKTALYLRGGASGGERRRLNGLHLHAGPLLPVLIALVFAALALGTMVGVVSVISNTVHWVELTGPNHEGEARYDAVPPTDVDLRSHFSAASGGHLYFILAENAIYAGNQYSPAGDHNDLTRIAASMRQHGHAWNFWLDLEDNAMEYAAAVEQLREDDLPEVLAALPESVERRSASYLNSVAQNDEIAEEGDLIEFMIHLHVTQPEPVIARHLLAACYYGQSYGAMDAFSPYRMHVGTGGYCDSLDIPSRGAVRQHALER